MQHGLALQCERLEGMANGVAQVESLAQALLRGVALHHALLHRHRLGHHAAQLREVGIGYVKRQQLRPHLPCVEQPVLQHLSVARQQVLRVHRAQKLGVDNHAVGVGEHAHLVFQSVQVYARLSAHRCVNHGQQRRGDVDEAYAALECRCGETAKVGHHSATYIYDERMARGAHAPQLRPHVGQRLKRLAGVAHPYHYALRPVHAHGSVGQWAAQAVGGLVGKREELVVGTVGDGLGQRLAQILRYRYLLFPCHIAGYKDISPCKVNARHRQSKAKCRVFSPPQRH